MACIIYRVRSQFNFSKLPYELAGGWTSCYVVCCVNGNFRLVLGHFKLPRYTCSPPLTWFLIFELCNRSR